MSDQKVRKPASVGKVKDLETCRTPKIGIDHENLSTIPGEAERAVQSCQSLAFASACAAEENRFRWAIGSREHQGGLQCTVSLDQERIRERCGQHLAVQDRQIVRLQQSRGRGY